jgi:Ca2+-binding EF-hand superfamily protein
MDGISEHLEVLWNDLLSRQPERIREAFSSLDPNSQKIVLAHLQRMAGEIGWQPEQRISAKAALNALENHIDQEE